MVERLAVLLAWPLTIQLIRIATKIKVKIIIRLIIINAMCNDNSEILIDVEIISLTIIAITTKGKISKKQRICSHYVTEIFTTNITVITA